MISVVLFSTHTLEDLQRAYLSIQEQSFPKDQYNIIIVCNKERHLLLSNNSTYSDAFFYETDHFTGRRFDFREGYLKEIPSQS